MEESYIFIGGYRIRFVERGKGRPLLLIHGLGASLEWWRLNLENLSKEQRVIAFDFLGFGLSSKPRVKFETELAVWFMRELLDAFHFDKVSLLGNSLGGYIALVTAFCLPERVENLVLVDNAGFGPEISLFLRVGSLYPMGELALMLRNTVAARLFLTRLFYETKKLPPDLLEFSLKVLEEKRAREICLEVLREGVSVKGVKQEIWHSVADKSASLPHKTLIIWGADDKITPLSQAYRGRRLIRNSKLIVFDRCGHLPQIEWPEKFNQSVLHFLKS